ncbi:hypothetical protein AUJ73_02890 [Candidatus Gottesmanbacteria bacterium CG1_02_37_22]|uniref:Membrane protein 6-pyruvoyl-tetrahydropterin synthase-related domain-containing protein n=3 Tax=Candidatus Gottesmaniibacteriota TaxID=1752720 RepID=A0A1J4TTZ0_9BACT|nr:MAG: hypothetical protein AUJ73_02890 [Candidatus Gottesmanbacteria bacterium CG1_02_37_22]
MMKKTIKYLMLILLILVSLGAARPLFFPGFFPMHDNVQVARVYEMSKSLSFGQIPVRLVSDLGYGYGYPIFNFYAPLPYYIGGAFNLLFFDSLTSTKIMFVVGIVLSGLSMFFLINEITDGIAAFTAAVFYIYAPYHAVNIYIRGAVGEFYAYAFVPLIALGLIKILKISKARLSDIDNKLERKDISVNIIRGVVIGSSGISGVLLSHNILGMLLLYYLFAFLIVYLLFFFRGKRNYQQMIGILFMILLGIGLSSFFTIPAFMEKKYTRVDSLIQKGSDFHLHFVYPEQLWDSSWGFAGSAPGKEDGMSFKIGKLHIFLAISSLIILIAKRRKIGKKYLYFYFSILIILISSIFMMVDISTPFWNLLPLFSYIQYPWRFLNITLFALVVLSSFIFRFLNNPYKIGLSIVLIISVIYLNIRYFVPSGLLQVKASDYINLDELHFNMSKISDEYLPKEFNPPENINQVALSGIPSIGSIKVVRSVEEPTHKIYDLELVEPQKLLTNIAYLPGWKVFIDGNLVEVINSAGRLMLTVPEGKHSVEFVLGQTAARIVGNTISLLSLFLLVYVSLFQLNIFYGHKKIFR